MTNTLIETAKNDLRGKSITELKALHVSDRTGLVVAELIRRARQGSYDAIIAQPNS